MYQIGCLELREGAVCHRSAGEAEVLNREEGVEVEALHLVEEVEEVEVAALHLVEEVEAVAALHLVVEAELAEEAHRRHQVAAVVVEGRLLLDHQGAEVAAEEVARWQRQGELLAWWRHPPRWAGRPRQEPERIPPR